VTKLPRDEQPICHFCVRPQEDHTVLFVVDEDGQDGSPNICDTCVRAAYELLLELGAKARSAKKRARLVVVRASDEVVN
jgi:hypothetical protein